MNDIVIAVRKMTDALSEGLILGFVAASNIQLKRDFKPIWGIDVTVVYVPAAFIAPPGAWICALEDHSPDADALGFHELTPAGQPCLHAFIKDDLASGNNPYVTIQHEILEAAVDPFIDQVVKRFFPDGRIIEVAKEIGDPPEDDENGYLIEANGVSYLMPDFVTPDYYDEQGKGRLTFRNTIAEPFGLISGGYNSIRQLAPTSTAWDQHMADQIPSKRALKGHWSRTMRRRRRDSQLLLSL